jgi:hypothetical protein
VLSADARVKARELIDAAYQRRSPRFGNARFIRNLFEHAITNQAAQLIKRPSPDRTELTTISAEDLPIEDDFSR